MKSVCLVFPLILIVFCITVTMSFSQTQPTPAPYAPPDRLEQQIQSIFYSKLGYGDNLSSGVEELRLLIHPHAKEKDRYYWLAQSYLAQGYRVNGLYSKAMSIWMEFQANQEKILSDPITRERMEWIYEVRLPAELTHTIVIKGQIFNCFKRAENYEAALGLIDETDRFLKKFKTHYDSAAEEYKSKYPGVPEKIDEFIQELNKERSDLVKKLKSEKLP